MSTAGASSGWFDASAVMATSGAIQGSSVLLGDGDLPGGAMERMRDATRLVSPMQPEPVQAAAADDAAGQVAARYAAYQLPS